MDKSRLTVILVQYDRSKYSGSLPRLIGVIERLKTVAPTFVVVDNAREGDWVHWVADDFLHVGGNNRGWEFSAFDRGLEVVQREGLESDAFLLVTDAFRAYGEDFLGRFDDSAIQCCARLQACVGWMDSFMQDCRIGDRSYDTWIRTSFVLLPSSLPARLRPLEADLQDLSLFSDDPAYPFSPEARISANLQALLVEWLTNHDVPMSQLSERWHSRFDLDETTFPLFRRKVASILREHAMSARLSEDSVPCYDLRCTSGLADHPGALEGFLAAGGSSDLQWLGWREALPRAINRFSEALPDDGPDLDYAEPILVFAGLLEDPECSGAIDSFSQQVLPLIRQRTRGARLLVLTRDLEAPDLREVGESEILIHQIDRLEDADLPANCVAIVAPGSCDTSSVGDFVSSLAGDLPLVAHRSIAATLGSDGVRSVESPVEFATECCQLADAVYAGEE